MLVNLYATKMELKDWIKAARTHKGWTQQQLGDAVGRTKANVGHWETGKHEPKFDLIEAISSATGYPPPIIGQAPSQSNIIALHPDDELPPGTIQVPEFRIRFSGGNGSVAVEYEEAEGSVPATYRLEWLQREKLSPKKLARFKVTGESMEPVLFKGDTVLVNLAENDISRIVDGKVYAIRYEDQMRIKRLYRRLGGGLVLRSENPDYRDEEVSPEMVQQHITIIGRVRDKSGSGGL